MGKFTYITRKGFTLIELVSVIAIIALVSIIAITRVSRVIADSRRTVAEADLRNIREAIVGDESGYLNDMQGIAGFCASEIRIANLLVSTNLYGQVDSRKAGEYFPARRVDEVWLGPGTAKPKEFTTWSEETSRGWRGPYLKHPSGIFPSRDAKISPYGQTAEERGFFPDISNLYLSEEIKACREVSIYGFPGELAVLDPWGNPYVLQIPPPQAFGDEAKNIDPEKRWRYARIVSAGENGFLETPCFGANATNAYASAWNERTRRLSRQAGLVDTNDISARGDDLVLFISRSDIDEGEGGALE